MAKVKHDVNHLCHWVTIEGVYLLRLGKWAQNEHYVSEKIWKTQ